MRARRSLGLTFALALFHSAVQAQPALERLEKQLNNPSSVPSAKESGYLGLITRNDAAGGFIRIVQVVPDSPAATAGLRTDDLILSADGRLTRNMNDLAAALQGRAPGDRVSLAVMHGQEEQTITVTLGRRSTAEGPALIGPHEGAVPGSATVARPLTPPATSTQEPQSSAPMRSDVARLDLLERRMAELERRLADLERLLSRRP